MSLCIMIFLFLFFSLPFFQGAYTRPSPAQLLKELRLVRGSVLLYHGLQWEISCKLPMPLTVDSLRGRTIVELGSKKENLVLLYYTAFLFLLSLYSAFSLPLLTVLWAKILLKAAIIMKKKFNSKGYCFVDIFLRLLGGVA